MSQSTSFPPFYSSSIRGIGSTNQESEALSLIPLDTLPAKLTVSEQNPCPSLHIILPALMEGEVLKIISKENLPLPTEQEILSFLKDEKLPAEKELAAGLAVLNAIPFPLDLSILEK